ncbi:MAG: fibrillarin-like rRNA/tRNA 2'-O-methyltransferase, partial [Acidianus sp.]
DIAIYNAKIFLKEGGSLLLAIKARSIDVTKNPEEIFKEESSKLERNNFDVKQVINLDPYDKDHAMVLARFKG